MTDQADIEGGSISPPESRSVTPTLPRHVFGKLSAYIEIKRALGRDALTIALRKLGVLWQDEPWSLELRAVALILADLLDQGWEINTDDTVLHLQPPGLRLNGEQPELAKERLRRALQIGRDRQLAEPNVQKFLDRMHRTTPRVNGRSSIADVIDNGFELAELLRPLVELPKEQMTLKLKTIIDPVIEVCDENAKCTVTGLRLIDIWRYFRHTWSLEYRSIPGRQLALLIRNGARPKKPVIGIALLASPVLRMRVRDNWIGWNTEPFIAKLRSGEWDSEIALRALLSRIEANVSEIRSDDLVSPDEIAFPTERTILRLEQRFAGAAAARQRELEELYSQAKEANETIRSQRDDAKISTDWRKASEDLLFVRKRAETLAQLLDAKRTYQSVNWSRIKGAPIDALVQHPNGLRTLGVALTETRKAGLSSQIADVSVCGAVAPYNTLLGGKLVALLMNAKEVRDAYRERYSKQVSLISSQMAGRPIYRPAELKILTTTSLYGNGSSQYNRLRLKRTSYPELEHDLAWQELAQTAGYGTVHLKSETVRILREVSEQLYRARRINNRFGEGASPRLRQIRESLDALGIDSTHILNHATPRVFYGCELHPGAREELLGLYPTTVTKGSAVATISDLWATRWLANRIRNPAVLSQVASANAQTLADFFGKLQRAAELQAATDFQGDLFLDTGNLNVAAKRTSVSEVIPNAIPHAAE